MTENAEEWPEPTPLHATKEFDTAVAVVGLSVFVLSGLALDVVTGGAGDALAMVALVGLATALVYSGRASVKTMGEVFGDE